MNMQLFLDACVHINIACAYTSVQIREHHLLKLHRHIFLILVHCTLHYICSFVLYTLLIGGNKELLYALQYELLCSAPFSNLRFT